jgi:hypothetical protein
MKEQQFERKREREKENGAAVFGLLQILDNIRRSKIILDIFLQLLLPLILKKVN